MLILRQNSSNISSNTTKYFYQETSEVKVFLFLFNSFNSLTLSFNIINQYYSPRILVSECYLSNWKLVNRDHMMELLWLLLEVAWQVVITYQAVLYIIYSNKKERVREREKRKIEKIPFIIQLIVDVKYCLLKKKFH